jgi:hypothetical protein
MSKMAEKTTLELLEEYEKWKRRHESLLEDHGLVARTLTPGQRLETPKKPLTPEALEAIEEAKHKMDEAYEDYMASLR